MTVSVRVSHLPRPNKHRRTRVRGRLEHGFGPGSVLELLEARLLLSGSASPDVAPFVPRPIVPTVPAEVQPPTVKVPVKSTQGATTTLPIPRTVPKVAPPADSRPPVITVLYNPNQANASGYAPLISIPVSSGPVAGRPASDADPANLEQDDPELTPDGLFKLPTVPMMDDVMVSGNLVPEQTWSTYKIPLNPSTQFLHLTINHEPSPSVGMVPALDQLYLVGPTGGVLAKLTGAAAAMQGPLQDVNVGLSGVPSGSSLLVRIVETPLVSAAEPSSSNSNPSVASLSFTMEITRYESPASGFTPVISQPFGSQFGLPVGYLAWSDQVSLSLVGDADFSSSARAAAAELYGKAPEEAKSLYATAQPLEELSLAAPVVSLGPLVSRGSAPLGPPLATTSGEPTPEIDRAERALNVSELGVGSVLVGSLEFAADLPARREYSAVVNESSRGSGDDSRPDEPFLLLRGPGGFPVLGTNVGLARAEVDSTEILATVASLAVPDSSGDAPAGTFIEYTAQAVSSEPYTRSDLAHPDFLTAACGLVLGISLTAGPLYPDLIALMKNRWKGKTRQGHRPGIRRPWNRLLTGWLGALAPRGRQDRPTREA